MNRIYAHLLSFVVGRQQVWHKRAQARHRHNHDDHFKWNKFAVLARLNALLCLFELLLSSLVDWVDKPKSN